MAVDSATDLGPCADGGSFAFQTLRLVSLALEGGLESLNCKPLVHLRTVNISDNRLTSLRGLETLASLTALDARSNWLTLALDYPAPVGGSRLRRADLGDNRLVGCVGQQVGVHAELETLLLDTNALTDLGGIERLEQLCELSLASNRLSDTCAVGADGLQPARWTDVIEPSRGEAATVGALATLQRLRRLDVSSNRLSRLGPLLRVIGGAPLTTLCLLPNPFEDVPIGRGVHASLVVCWGRDELDPHVLRTYRQHMLRTAPLLIELDGVPIAGEERVAAAALGEDEEPAWEPGEAE